MTKEEKNKIWLGVGLAISGSLLIGGGVGYIVGSKRTERRIRKNMKDDLRRAHERGYNQGYDEGSEEATVEAQKWIDDNIIRVDADNPEAAQKALEGYFNASKDSKTSTSSDKPEAVKRPLEGQREAIKEDKLVEMPKEPEVFDETAQLRLDTDNKVIVYFHGEPIAIYPRELFFYDNGDSYSETQVRARLIDFEKNIKVLKRVWMAFGWGEYFPDPSLGCPTKEEIDNWDLEIESDAKLGDEPEERTKQRERYLDEMERYREHPENGPRIISRQEFDDECYLDKIYVDYYEDDNKFIENTDVDTPLDAFENFGVTNGKDLFGKDTEDPDIVHIKNFKMNFVAEITRYHRSYASIADGSAYLDGGTGLR